MARQFTIDAETKHAVLRAIYEVGFITVLSLLPLVAIAYYQYVEQHPLPPANRSHTLWDLVYNNTAAGQLAFYAIANWAVVAWICGLEKKAAHSGSTDFHPAVHCWLLLLRHSSRDNLGGRLHCY